MQLAPIIIFTYRRVPNKLVTNLSKNRLAKDSELFIFSDGYKNDIDKKDVLEVREYLKTIKGFKKVTIIERKENWGLAKNIINGVTDIINQYDKVIVLEDDLIVSSDFLEYMNEALNFYKNDKKIWSISGYSPNMECLRDYNKDTYLSVRASSWGWASWKDRWDSIDWDIKDWQVFKKDKNAINEFNLGGNDMYKMLELQMLGKIDSWAIRWCYNQYKLSKYTIYPIQSKVINDGFLDNLGTHNSGFDQKFSVTLCDGRVYFIDVNIDKDILECFRKFHNLSLQTQIGYFLKKYGGYKLVKKIYDKIKLKGLE